jgi:hypothetical protein
MSFDPTKKVQTQDGRMAGIYSTGNEGNYPIHGWTRSAFGNREIKVWTAEGFTSTSQQVTRSTLVNVPDYPPLPKVEGGHLEYRGKGWSNEQKACRYFASHSGYQTWSEYGGKNPSGNKNSHYAEFIPEYPALPEVEGGRLEYRGKEWKNNGKACRFFTCHEGDLRWFQYKIGYTPAGNPTSHYAEFIPDAPKFRPYSLETFPMWAVWIRPKGILARKVITDASLFNLKTRDSFYNYPYLMDNCEIAGVDGIWHPAGQEVKP